MGIPAYERITAQRTTQHLYSTWTVTDWRQCTSNGLGGELTLELRLPIVKQNSSDVGSLLVEFGSIPPSIKLLLKRIVDLVLKCFRNHHSISGGVRRCLSQIRKCVFVHRLCAIHRGDNLAFVVYFTIAAQSRDLDNRIHWFKSFSLSNNFHNCLDSNSSARPHAEQSKYWLSWACSG